MMSQPINAFIGVVGFVFVFGGLVSNVMLVKEQSRTTRLISIVSTPINLL